MSCDTLTRNITVLGDGDIGPARRRRYDDDDHYYMKTLHDSESFRDVISEIKESKLHTADKIADLRAALLEAKHDIVVKILEAKCDDERGKRETLRDLFELRRDVLVKEPYRGRHCNNNS